MNLRNVIWGMLVLSMFSLSALPAISQNALIGQRSSLDATILRYQPNPAEPGDVVDVYILLSNSGGGSARNIILQLQDNYPFRVDNPQEAVKTIPQLPGQESYVARFKVRVDKDASEGVNYLKVNFKEEGSQASKDEYLELSVLTNDAIISIERISVEPQTVQPGQQAVVDLALKNYADSRLRDIAVSLQTSRTVGTTTSIVPIAPVQGSFERRITEMMAGEELLLHYEIIVEPDAASDVYKIPVSLQFSDETGRKYNISDQIGLVVNAAPSLTVYLDSITAFADSRRGDFTLKLVNSGLSEIKFLNLEVMPSAGFDLITTSPKVYIGNIDSDDYETARFSISAKQAEFTIPVRLHYLDAFNKEYTKEEAIPVKLLTAAEASNGKPASKTGYIIIAAVVLVIGFFVYRRIRRNRKMKKSK